MHCVVFQLLLIPPPSSIITHTDTLIPQEIQWSSAFHLWLFDLRVHLRLWFKLCFASEDAPSFSLALPLNLYVQGTKKPHQS